MREIAFLPAIAREDAMDFPASPLPVSKQQGDVALAAPPCFELVDLDAERTNRRKMWSYLHLTVARRRTPSKQSPLAPFYLCGKIFACFLAFPSPQKVRWTFRGPRKSQDFKGKRSNRAKRARLRQQTALYRTLRRRRAVRLVRSSKAKEGEIRKTFCGF